MKKKNLYPRIILKSFKHNSAVQRDAGSSWSIASISLANFTPLFQALPSGLAIYMKTLCGNAATISILASV